MKSMILGILAVISALLIFGAFVWAAKFVAWHLLTIALATYLLIRGAQLIIGRK